jgi:dinuclear metal center YbgI/SA1388 family protein
MKIREIISCLESYAPLALQESYDNAGLIIGNNENTVKGVLICVDISFPVIKEAVLKNCNLIISHHPLIFKPLKKITEKSDTDKMIIELIRKEIAVYAFHTNIDSVKGGINAALAEKFQLTETRFLDHQKGILRKLVTFCPVSVAGKVREAVFKAGSGNIGNYDSCSFNVNGEGSFRANESANPFVGERNKLHFEKEVRIETVFPFYLEHDIIAALLKAHPYEEVAYDIYSLENESPISGDGMIGNMKKELKVADFLKKVKSALGIKQLRYCTGKNDSIKKVALCGGSGGFLIEKAIQEKADVFITSDIKYHDFQRADRQILLIDAGHFETEQHVKELLLNVLSEKFPTFAFQISKTDKNPVKYL